MKPLLRLTMLAAIALIALVVCTSPKDKPIRPKNVIIFIGDGMGFNHVNLVSLYFYGDTNQLLFEKSDWYRLAAATYPAIMKKTDNKIEWGQGYNPQAAYTDPSYLKSGYTDSGAGGTMISTGVKTYRGNIGLGPDGDTLLHLSEYAKQLGKAAGVVSSVMFSHATPASFSTHNVFRDNYEQIAQSMLLKSKLDLVMGTGHPEFDSNGMSIDSVYDYQYVGGKELWTQLTSGSGQTTFTIGGNQVTVQDIDGDKKPDPWTLITDSADFATLLQGKTLPKRLLGVPKNISTLQQNRKGKDAALPFAQPMVPGMPTLEQMTLGAINVLNQNRRGFFLMVEGGAIDWASHDTNTVRTIEEMHDFIKAIEATIRWVEQNSSWDETLVIITADHETGMLFGPPAKDNIFTPLQNNGKNNLPGVRWHYTNHTNSLVPVFMKGSNAEKFIPYLDELDPKYGPFAQSTEIAQYIFRLWGRY